MVKMCCGAAVIPQSESECRTEVSQIKKDEKKTRIQTCDGVPKHRCSRSLVVDRRDGHVVLSLGDEAGQVRGGDVTVNFELPGTNLIISSR